ncbi:hypothetical protein [Deinococcus sp. Leaf326]|uniref:hypothetical protein n=1 Tax=Deinococcus sp. Leaf326 TaxID=1736338 RepID=UPI0006FB387A|nr:hypothetical protein [Deinococcus sp. Leaf326]KQR15592.1 hypothetical protein ASF71_08110 [Deinococcus sp. Leaf326]
MTISIPLFAHLGPKPDLAFQAAVEHPAFFAIAGIVERVYDVAMDEGKKLLASGPDRRRVVPHLRQAILEEEIRKLPVRFPDVVATNQPYKTGNGSFVLLRIQDALVCVACVRNEDALPRKAEFRAVLRRLNQWTLEESMSGAGPLQHILVTHGASKGDMSKPAFTLATKPSACGTYYLQKYDLRQHPTANLVLPTPQTPITPAAGVQLERQVSLKARAKQQNEE